MAGLSCMVTYGVWLLLMSLCVVTLADGNVNNQPNAIVNPKVSDLRKRWGAAEIVRDMEHIKEDMKKLSELQGSGDLSANEALFYFTRMHDFDDNKKLDGLELLVAMRHSMEHHSGTPTPFDEITEIVDSFFKYDDNGDGFISYPELRTHLADQPAS